MEKDMSAISLFQMPVCEKRQPRLEHAIEPTHVNRRERLWSAVVLLLQH
jgi:hypothetical protein